ncbi:MAG: hypothetical protein E7334_06615 [Clostridiales bacterium]|nr:hypothetical protein [Clostridiales bacterium]
MKTRLFTKDTIKAALKAVSVWVIIDFLCIFVGTGSLADSFWIGWGLFAGFLFIHLIAGFSFGAIKGENDMRRSVVLDHQKEKTGREFDQNESDSRYDPKKGVAIALMCAIPGLIFVLGAIITGDKFDVMRIINRFYFSPYMRLFSLAPDSLINILYYFIGALVYPAVYAYGYLRGKVNYEKTVEQLRKNDEDYRNGIRRKRPKVKKRRRGLFG